MVYIKNWTDFETAASDVYKNAPTRARYSVKFVQKTGQLVLKVTDDTTCIMYKTFSSIVLNRFEALNLRLLSQIANVKPKPRPSIPVPAGIERAGTPMRAGTPGAEGDDPMEGRERASTPAAAQTPGGAGAGGKKKKKGKR